MRIIHPIGDQADDADPTKEAFQFLKSCICLCLLCVFQRLNALSGTCLMQKDGDQIQTPRTSAQNDQQNDAPDNRNGDGEPRLPVEDGQIGEDTLRKRLRFHRHESPRLGGERR